MCGGVVVRVGRQQLLLMFYPIDCGKTCPPHGDPTHFLSHERGVGNRVDREEREQDWL